MVQKNNSYFLIYYYSLFSVLSSISFSCIEVGKKSIVDEKYVCCIRHENLRKILDMLTRTLKKEKGFNRIRISRNTFNTIITELNEYGIIIEKLREGSNEGRGYKRYVMIYDVDTISKARQCIGSILGYELTKLIEEKINELRNGIAKTYFNDLIMELQECFRSLRDVGF